MTRIVCIKHKCFGGEIMDTLYIIEQGCFIGKRSECLIIRKPSNEVEEVQVNNLKSLVIAGNHTISTQALTLLFNSGIDVIFSSKYGGIKGKTVSSESKNVFLRINQYKRWEYDFFKLNISKVIVEQKINNLKNKYSKCFWRKCCYTYFFAIIYYFM